MARIAFIGVLVVFVFGFHIVPFAQLRAQAPGTAGPEHLTEVACVDVPPDVALSTRWQARLPSAFAMFDQLCAIRCGVYDLTDDLVNPRPNCLHDPRRV
jgi:hypothetical protein